MPEIKKFDFDKRYYAPNLSTQREYFISTKDYVKKELEMTHLLDGTIQGVYEACRVIRENIPPTEGDPLTLYERRDFILKNETLVKQLNKYIVGKINNEKTQTIANISLFKGIRTWFAEKQAEFDLWRLRHKIDPLMKEIDETKKEVEERIQAEKSPRRG